MIGDQKEQGGTENNSKMDSDLTVATKDEGFWREMWHQVRLVLHLVRDPNVPLYLKLLPLAAVIYVLIPTDFIPDIFPVVGQLDDLTALIVGGKIFIELAPQKIVAQYLESMRQKREELGEEDGQSPDEQSESGDQGGVIIEGEYEEVDLNEDE
ncbi:MAG: hypothetical protein BMS9Abin02_0623 [Anaerolineae bacterium]|nr:MAG: hypothetical protein BMS9Abin02_0623 [Anaerolineae bacterium]